MWSVRPEKKHILEIGHDWCRAFYCILIGPANFKLSDAKCIPISWHIEEGVVHNPQQHTFNRDCVESPDKLRFSVLGNITFLCRSWHIMQCKKKKCWYIDSPHHIPMRGGCLQTLLFSADLKISCKWRFLAKGFSNPHLWSEDFWRFHANVDFLQKVFQTHPQWRAG